MNILRNVLLASVMSAFLAQPALAGWREAKTKHFIIYSEQSAGDLKEFAQELEQFDRGVRLLRGMDDPTLTDSGRLRIYVLPSQRDVAQMANSSSGVAGFYLSRASGSLAFVHSAKEDRRAGSLSAKTVFFHEYQHHLMLQSMNLALPLWITEGSAEFFATARREKDGSMTFGAPPQHRAFGLFQVDALSIEEMVGATAEKLTPIEREQTYARGWLLIHMLVFDARRKGQLTAYADNIQKGMSALDAARAAFGDLKTLDQDLGRYLAARKFAGFSVPKAAFADTNVAIRDLSPAEDAILPTVMRSDRGVDTEQARRILDGAKKVAVRFPSDAVVLAALAEAEQDAGNNEAAIAAADRAIATAPNFSKPKIMKARAMLAIGKKDRAKTDWAALRVLIGQANKLDPEDAEPMMLFYQSYVDQGIAPTKTAVEGLLYAQVLVPRDRGLRMMAVRQMIVDKRLSEAELLFGPLANDPHGGGESRDAMAKVMVALKARDAKQALELIDAASKPRAPATGRRG